MEVIMFKRIALLGLIVSSTYGLATPQTQSQKKIVTWDIHKVLFTKQGKHGYQCTPQESTFELVKELHAKGVKQVILSNISSESFCELSRCYPQHFKYIDLSRSFTNAKFIFTRKPHGKCFKKFLKKNKYTRPSDIVFFDDKLKNVKGARELCIDGQLFCNAAQARTILKHKGLL